MKTIAKIYVEGKYFKTEANRTIGIPGVGPNAEQIFLNRRLVTSKLNEVGKNLLKMKVAEIEREFSVRVLKVRWDKNAGCGMCPCSPGFRVYGDDSIKLEEEWARHGKDIKYLFDGWIE